MEIRKSTVTQFAIALALIALGVALRFVPHMPNFAPVGAIALFAGATLNWRIAVWLPLLIMMLSDAVLGFYPGIEYTWAGFLLVALFGGLIKNWKLPMRSVIGGLSSAVIFFIVSNFGVWLASGMYAHTMSGLAECYALALPFLRATLLGDVFYAFVLFGAYELATMRVMSRANALTQ